MREAVTFCFPSRLVHATDALFGSEGQRSTVLRIWSEKPSTTPVEGSKHRSGLAARLKVPPSIYFVNSTSMR
jgi:hypothetical protein